jgi:hypothetical protein
MNYPTMAPERIAALDAYNRIGNRYTDAILNASLFIEPWPLDADPNEKRAVNLGLEWLAAFEAEPDRPAVERWAEVAALARRHEDSPAVLRFVADFAAAAERLAGVPSITAPNESTRRGGSPLLPPKGPGVDAAVFSGQSAPKAPGVDPDAIERPIARIPKFVGEPEVQMAQDRCIEAHGVDETDRVLEEATQVFVNHPASAMQSRLDAVAEYCLALADEFGPHDERVCLVAMLQVGLHHFACAKIVTERWLEGVDLQHFDGPMPDET